MKGKVKACGKLFAKTSGTISSCSIYSPKSYVKAQTLLYLEICPSDKSVSQTNHLPLNICAILLQHDSAMKQTPALQCQNVQQYFEIFKKLKSLLLMRLGVKKTQTAMCRDTCSGICFLRDCHKNQVPSLLLS